jgi:hypothetical protein
MPLGGRVLAPLRLEFVVAILKNKKYFLSTT